MFCSRRKWSLLVPLKTRSCCFSFAFEILQSLHSRHVDVRRDMAVTHHCALSCVQLKIPPGEIDLTVKEYASISCALVDIPVYDSQVQALHVLFTLYSEFRSNQHFTNHLTGSLGSACDCACVRVCVCVLMLLLF